MGAIFTVLNQQRIAWSCALLVGLYCSYWCTRPYSGSPRLSVRRGLASSGWSCGSPDMPSAAVRGGQVNISLQILLALRR